MRFEYNDMEYDYTRFAQSTAMQMTKTSSTADDAIVAMNNGSRVSGRVVE